MPLIKIDDLELEVESGINVVEAARQAGVEIPHYCYHPGLSRPANCRMCVVDIGARQLATACTTVVREAPPDRKIDDKYDLVVQTKTERVKEAREYILEFLLVHHPLDCPVCDQAGECDLQDFSFRYGKGKSRYDEIKNVPPKKDLGGDVLLYSTRCIVCTRCIRFCDEISGTSELGIIHRGSKDEIDVMRDEEGKPLRPIVNKLSGNVVDICPVGALVSKDFLFKSRPWFLKKVNSVCAGCSKGCAITIEFKEDGVYRIKPRYHPGINGYWICDDGRLGYHYVNSEDRLQLPLKRDGEALKPISWAEALRTIQERVAAISSPDQQILVAGSAYATNEENYLIGKLAEALGTQRIGLYGRPQGERHAFPGFVIEADKNPNMHGARRILGEVAHGDSLWGMVEASEFAFILVGTPPDPLDDKARKALESVDFLVIQDLIASEITDYADLVLPGVSFAEKEGTFTNSTGWVQRLHPSIEPPGEARSDWLILRELVRRLGGVCDFESVDEILDRIAEEIEAFAEVTSEELGDKGICIAPAMPSDTE